MLRTDTDRFNTRVALVSLGVLCMTCSSYGSAAADLPFSLSDPLVKPIVYFKVGDYGHLRSVSKTWDETFDARRRFHYLFLGQFDSPPKGYMQSLTVYDGNKEIDTFDWDSPDCSLEKILLGKDEKSQTYLFVANRSRSSANILPQNEPAPLDIMAFLLTDNTGETFGKPRAYFQKIAEMKTDELACTSDETYRLLKQKAAFVIRRNR